MAELLVTAKTSGLKDGEVSFEERAKMINRRIETEKRMEKERKKSIYKHFAQLNEEKITNIMFLFDENPFAVQVLLFIIQNMDKMNALVVSYQVMVERLGRSRQTISKAVNLLKEHGFLYVYKAGTTNVYTLNPEIAWKNHGDKVVYSRFPANVMLSLSEQEPSVKYQQLKFVYTEESEQE